MLGIRFRWSVSLVALLVVIVMTGGISMAKEENISTVGEYVMGQDDTLQKAQDGALSDALRAAAEQIGIYVKAHTRMDDFEVTKDQVEVLMGHSLKIGNKRFERILTPNGDIHIKAYVDVSYDPDAVLVDLRSIEQGQEPATSNGRGQEFTLHMIGVGDRTGTYEGERNAAELPHGKGKFSTKNPQGVPWYYEGEFRNGHFYGQGKQVWPTIGQMEQGSFVDDRLHGYGKRSNPNNSQVNYEGNFVYGSPMLGSVHMGQIMEFGDWAYTAVKVQTGTTAGNVVANGKYVCVYVSAKNLSTFARQIGANNFFVLFDRTNGSIYPYDGNAMGSLVQAMITSGRQNPAWFLTTINPGITVEGIPFLFDVPQETPVGNLLLLPKQGFGKVAPIQLQEL